MVSNGRAPKFKWLVMLQFCSYFVAEVNPEAVYSSDGEIEQFVVDILMNQLVFEAPESFGKIVTRISAYNYLH